MIFISVIPQMKELGFTRTVFAFNTICKKRHYSSDEGKHRDVNEHQTVCTFSSAQAVKHFSCLTMLAVTRIMLRASHAHVFLFPLLQHSSFSHRLFMPHFFNLCSLISSQPFLLEIIILPSKKLTIRLCLWKRPTTHSDRALALRQKNHAHHLKRPPSTPLYRVVFGFRPVLTWLKLHICPSPGPSAYLSIPSPWS